MGRFFLVFLFLRVTISFAQFDNPNGGNLEGKTIGTVKMPIKKVEKPTSLDFNNDNGFKTANQKLKEKRLKEQQKKAIENKGILTPQTLAKRNYKKNIEGKFANFPMIDMDLGSFHTVSKNIYISSYDFGQFDGDKVQITANGKRVHNNYLLTPQVQTIKIPLDAGINKIEVTALNEGKLVPNTGYFAFFDDNKYIIKEGQWMLATGAKVVVIVVRDDR